MLPMGAPVDKVGRYAHHDNHAAPLQDASGQLDELDQRLRDDCHVSSSLDCLPDTESRGKDTALYQQPVDLA